MSATPAQPRSTDDATMILGVVIFALVAFALTPVGLLSAVVPTACLRLTGRPSLPIAFILTAAMALGLTLYFEGAEGVGADFFNVFRRSAQDPLAAFQAWAALGLKRPVWSLTVPIGLIVGSYIALMRDAQGRSPLAALSKGQVLPQSERAPLANFFHRRSEKHPSRAKDGTVLGTEWSTGKQVTISDADLCRHMLVAGTTGSGKTTTTMNLIESCQNGVVIIDGKGDTDLAHKVMTAARQQGRKALPFDGTQTFVSDVYNPIASGDFTALADRVLTLREWTEPHYKRLAQQFAQTTFKVLQACGSGLDLLTVSKAMRVDELLKLVKVAVKSGHLSNDQGSTLLREASGLRGLERHIDGLHAEIEILASSVLGELFDIKRVGADRALIDLKAAREEKAIVYFCLPALRYPEFARTLGALVVNDLKYVVSSSHTPWQVVCDEFSVFAGPQILNLLNQGRGFGLSCILATQSLADIAQGSDKDKDKFLDQVFGSINSYVIHRLNSAADRELIAGVIGTKNSIEYTAQTVGGLGTGAASARHTKEFWIHPDSIRGLPTGAAVYVNKNVNTASIIKVRNPTV